MDWIELKIETIHEKTDLVADVLYDAGVNGVVIEDPSDIRMVLDLKSEDEYIEPALLDDCPDKVIIKGYLPADESSHDRLEMVKDRSEELLLNCKCCGTLKLTIGEVNEEDWAESWRKYYKPIKIGNNIVIKPSWETYNTQERDVIIEIDPGMAFGTGTHETTVLCIRLLEKYMIPDARVFDIGCGSGILSIVAAKLGADRVEAFDIQKNAVKIAKKNTLLNDIQHTVRVQHGNLFEKVKDRADLIVANIIADVIIKMSQTIKDYILPGGIFISSGIIKDRSKEVVENLNMNGMEIIEEVVLNEWTALVAKMKG